ncbi:MAG: hypothetical protein ACTSQP_05675 [Promethearchaeota archaeon]
MAFIKIWEKCFDIDIIEVRFIKINEPILFLKKKTPLRSSEFSFIGLSNNSQIPVIELPYYDLEKLYSIDLDGCGLDEIFILGYGLYIFKWINNRYILIWENSDQSYVYTKYYFCRLQGLIHYDFIACLNYQYPDGFHKRFHIFLYNDGVWTLYRSFPLFKLLNSFLKDFNFEPSCGDEIYIDIIFKKFYKDNVLNAHNQNCYYILRLKKDFYEKECKSNGLDIYPGCCLREISLDKDSMELHDKLIIKEDFKADLNTDKQGFFDFDFINLSKGNNEPYLILQREKNISLYEKSGDKYIFLNDFQIFNDDNDNLKIIQMGVYDIDNCGNEEILILDSGKSLRILGINKGIKDQKSLILKYKINLNHDYNSFQIIDFDLDGQKEILLHKKKPGVITIYKNEEEK